jgi:hypothetical protein
MSSRSNHGHSTIPTYYEQRNGATTVRCRKTTADSELAKLVIGADDWLLSTPELRAGSGVAKRLARRLRALRLGLDLPETDWQTGECEQFNLNRERLDLMLEHGREIFLGSTHRIDSDGLTREIAIIALAPCESRACDIVLDLDGAPVLAGGH